MGHFIIKIKDCYLEWSTIVDAPVTYGMGLEEFREYYQQEYGVSGMSDLPARLERVERTGTSTRDGQTAESLISCNRAGPNETELTLEEIYQKYCVDRPDE